jgi:hypothetical protein
MAARKKTKDPHKGSAMRQSQPQTAPRAAPTTRNKTAEIAQVICTIADSEGYFDPKDLYIEVRHTDLEKTASIVVSHLRLQGFRQNGLLRVPAEMGADLVKEFLSLTGKLLRKRTPMSFDDAVRSLLPPSEEQVSVVEPPRTVKAKPKKQQPIPGAARPETKAERGRPSVLSQATDYQVLYEEANEKMLRLEGELSAYKDMCAKLMEGLKNKG